MKQMIDLYATGSFETVKDSLNKQLTPIWQQYNPDKDSREYYILFEYGNQQSLIKMELSASTVKFFHDDFSFDRAASKTVKDALSEFLQANHIAEAKFFDISGAQKKAMQGASGFFSGGIGARMNVAPIDRVEVSPEERQAAKDQLCKQFPGLQLSDRAVAHLVAAYQGLRHTNTADLFAKQISSQTLLPTVAVENDVALTNRVSKP